MFPKNYLFYPLKGCSASLLGPGPLEVLLVVDHSLLDAVESLGVVEPLVAEHVPVDGVVCVRADRRNRGSTPLTPLTSSEAPHTACLVTDSYTVSTMGSKLQALSLIHI